MFLSCKKFIFVAFFLFCLIASKPHFTTSLSTTGMSSSNDKMTMTKKTSLGGPTLKSLVTKAAEEDNERAPDLSGILWLEHINLVVGCKDLASYFYLDVLGLTRDAGGSFHLNIGQQQLHLAQVEGQSAQRITGSIGLVFPNLDSLRARVREAAHDDRLKDSEFRIIDDLPDCLTLSCPWGNRLHCYSVLDDDTASAMQSSQKMVNLHASGGAYGPHRMAVRGQPGIRYVEIACPVDTVKSITRFYKELLGCTVSCTRASGTANDEIAPSSVVGTICFGPGVHLVLVEVENLSTADLDAMKGVHLCVYHNSFETLYQQLSSRNLIWTNPRFTHLDRCDTWEEANSSRTLRFQDIVDLETGTKVLELEHETRSLRHGQYLKVPNYNPV